MFYLTEAWSLFKKTWWPQVRLALAILVLVVPLCALLAVTAYLVRTHLVAGLITGLLLTLAWSALMSAAWFAHAVLISWTYFEERPRVWRLVFRGFTYWGRMLLLGLCYLLFALPVMAPIIIWGIVAALRSGTRPEWLNTLSLVLSPFSIVLSIYVVFALLNAVRLDMRAWRSWMSAWRLVPRRDWWRTVGSLVGLEVLFTLACQLAFLPLRGNTALSLGAAVGFLLTWLIAMLVGFYFILCEVAIWHRYTRLPEDEVSPAPSAFGIDNTGKVDAGV